MRILAGIIHAIRALHRPAAGPPPKLNEPAPAPTGNGLFLKVLGWAAPIISRRIAAAKRDRTRRAARLRTLLEAVIADQRGEGHSAGRNCANGETGRFASPAGASSEASKSRFPQFRGGRDD